MMVIYLTKKQEEAMNHFFDLGIKDAKENKDKRKLEGLITLSYDSGYDSIMHRKWKEEQDCPNDCPYSRM